jgi:hypothetical protein
MFKLKDDPRSLIRTERDIRALDLGTHFVPLGDEEEYCECIVTPGARKDDKVIIMVWDDDFSVSPIWQFADLWHDDLDGEYMYYEVEDIISGKRFYIRAFSAKSAEEKAYDILNWRVKVNRIVLDPGGAELIPALWFDGD